MVLLFQVTRASGGDTVGGRIGVTSPGPSLRAIMIMMMALSSFLGPGVTSRGNLGCGRGAAGWGHGPSPSLVTGRTVRDPGRPPRRVASAAGPVPPVPRQVGAQAASAAARGPPPPQARACKPPRLRRRMSLSGCPSLSHCHAAGRRRAAQRLSTEAWPGPGPGASGPPADRGSSKGQSAVEVTVGY
jgi:hypothetical protein